MKKVRCGIKDNTEINTLLYLNYAIYQKCIVFILCNTDKVGVPRQEQISKTKSRKAIAMTQKRVMCLYPTECDKKRKCCFTLFNPRSRCFTKCPNTWYELEGQKTDEGEGNIPEVNYSNIFPRFNVLSITI